MNKTQDERPKSSNDKSQLSGQPEEFRPPDVTGLASLTDGRAEGDFRSVYPGEVWFHIIIELLWLASILALSVYALISIAKTMAFGQSTEHVRLFLGEYPQNKTLLHWAVVALSASVGGVTASLKWLYHSVAKKRWHKDRTIWRCSVPFLSSVLAVFTGLMMTSGLIPFLNNSSLTNSVICAGFGFFLGLFSDNLLAMLQKFAFQVFGTVDSRSRHDGDVSTKDLRGKSLTEPGIEMTRVWRAQGNNVEATKGQSGPIQEAPDQKKAADFPTPTSWDETIVLRVRFRLEDVRSEGVSTVSHTTTDDKSSENKS